MNIKHMRLVLPSRLKKTVQADARMIAAATVRALKVEGAVEGPVNIQVQGHGRPAKFIAQDVARAAASQTRRRGG